MSQAENLGNFEREESRRIRDTSSSVYPLSGTNVLDSLFKITLTVSTFGTSTVFLSSVPKESGHTRDDLQHERQTCERPRFES